MKPDDILKFFVPKDHSFFPLFEEVAGILNKASQLLKLLMATENFGEREPIIKQIKSAEHDADDITHKIFQRLNKSFITPFDREDIQGLASSLDNVIDTINGTSQRISLYKPKTLMPVFGEMAEIIVQTSKEIEFSLHGLKNAGKNKDKIIQSCININSLENMADDLYHSGISSLFEKEGDTNELIKKKEIIETLEKTVDKAEDVSDVIKTILVKMS